MSDFDAFIMGSDQIWNPDITNGGDKIYWGQFPAAKGKKIISYAASVGCVKEIDLFMNEYLTMLQSYTAISVREQSLADYFSKQMLNISVCVTIDPVLLVGKAIFAPMIFPSKKQKPYLLAFQLYYNDSVKEIAEKVARQKGLDLVELVSSSETLKNKKCLTSESPESFLSLLKGASYVITSSFHGTALSILFEKDFNTVSIEASLSERMVNLLSQLNLTERLVDNNFQLVTVPIDYVSVNESLDVLRSSSKLFIENALA